MHHDGQLIVGEPIRYSATITVDDVGQEEISIRYEMSFDVDFWAISGLKRKNLKVSVRLHFPPSRLIV